MNSSTLTRSTRYMLTERDTVTERERDGERERERERLARGEAADCAAR